MRIDKPKSFHGDRKLAYTSSLLSLLLLGCREDLSLFNAREWNPAYFIFIAQFFSWFLFCIVVLLAKYMKLRLSNMRLDHLADRDATFIIWQSLYRARTRSQVVPEGLYNSLKAQHQLTSLSDVGTYARVPCNPPGAQPTS
jgi:hypothetical protein